MCFTHMSLTEEVCFEIFKLIKPRKGRVKKVPNHPSSLLTLTKSAVTMASCVCDPGNQTALMMKLPASS